MYFIYSHMFYYPTAASHMLNYLIVPEMAGISWKGLWKSIAAASGEDGTGAPVRTDGVDESRLE